MEKRVSYVIVGAFIVIIGISLLLFIFWLAKYGNKADKFDYYKSYFQESVSGLNIESSVKLYGVEVGRVREISINPNNSEEVEVLLELKAKTPIKVDTYAILDSQGITGLKYIELKGNTKTSALLKTSKENIAIIKSKKSLMSSLISSGDTLVNKVANVLNQLEKLFNNNTIENISKISKDLSNTSQTISQNRHKITQVLDNINTLSLNLQTNLNKITYNINDFVKHSKNFEDKLISSFENLSAMSKKVGAASDETKEFFAKMKVITNKGEFDVATIVEKNIEPLKNLSMELENMIKELKDSPSDILYKKSKKTLGPGESYE